MITREQLIDAKPALFWSIPREKRYQISDRVLVETILNYGQLEDIKALINLLGLEYVAEIFFESTKGTRHNYFPQVENFFRLYFKRHA